MRKFVIQKLEEPNKGQYAAPFKNGPTYTDDISKAYKFDTREEAEADCMPGEAPTEFDNPATAKLLKEMQDGANFIGVEEVYSEAEILAAADRLRS